MGANEWIIEALYGILGQIDEVASLLMEVEGSANKDEDTIDSAIVDLREQRDVLSNLLDRLAEEDDSDNDF